MRSEADRTNRWSRRRVLAGVAGSAAAALAGPALGQSGRKLQKVRVTTSWILGTGAIYAVVAKQKGFWRQRGYDIEIARGYGSTSSLQAIDRGQFDLGWSISTGPMIVQQSKGIDVQSVCQLLYRDTMAVVVLDGSPIRTPKDLEGKTLGVTQTSGEVPFIPAFAKNAGVDLSKVRIVSMNAEVRSRALIDGKIDAMTDYAMTALPPLISQGYALRTFPFAKYGLQLYSTGLVATAKTVKERPEMIQALVDGAMEAVKWSVLNPEESVELFLKTYPEMALAASSRENNRIGLGIVRYITLFEEARQNGLGYADKKMYETMNDYVSTYITKSPRKPPAEDLFTNRFVGKVRFTEAEWTKAKSLSEPFAKYVS
jgi:ABC-type nitrate/sulfonate/bicarbonate transport system substrate-binding protein